jgi:hypothetical protein
MNTMCSVALPAAVLSLSAMGATAASIEFVKAAHVDLNGDGRQESASLQVAQDQSSFVLRVNGAVMRGRLEPPIDGFRIVDINEHDRYKEVAVHTPGPSDDDEYLIYWYDGTTLAECGRLSRWPAFTGYGIVYVHDWWGFWGKTDKYVLDEKTHRLRLVPQELHWVGVTGTVRASVSIYETREKPAIVASLEPGSKALIVANAGDWYLIKSSTGLLGWMKESEVYRSFGDLPVAD